ncbi:putative glucan endo-1,3-alpha-glucosidase agn1 precursor [Halenospora varia]|nr:putative glucan endo-1,3-alpha-glucosidase agn1 precursor [Halenospora varia]
MKFLSTCLAASTLLVSAVQAADKYVFAHIVMGNTAAHNTTTWANDISLAKAAGIDAFVLNIGFGDANNEIQVANAFSAAETLGSTFKLFFSFDYLGGPRGAWPVTNSDADSVTGFINKYKGSAAYFRYSGNPMVSTFEGTGNVADWAPGGAIRSVTGALYFVPDWTSLGPSGAVAKSANFEGAFSWDMWPNGATNKTADSDKAWVSALGSSKSFMMGVSPWFFHSALPGEEWVWRGDDLWADRWQQVLDVKPTFVEIVTWNDYGEAHYIGPLPPTSEIPTNSPQYVNNMPHDSWRDFLPYYIAAYKGTPLTPTRDQMQYWYRLSPSAGGSPCNVNGNAASQGQTTVDPNTVMEDGVFFSAILTADATVTVQIGTAAAVSFAGKKGINHWSMPFGGRTGATTFSVVRNGAVVKSGKGAAIGSGTTLSSGCVNYNAWVGSF